MSKRVEIQDNLLDDIVGGNLTYTWYGGKGTCGLNNNNIWKFSNKEKFEDMMIDCMQVKGMSDIDTLKAMLAAGIIWK